MVHCKMFWGVDREEIMLDFNRFLKKLKWEEIYDIKIIYIPGYSSLAAFIFYNPERFMNENSS